MRSLTKSIYYIFLSILFSWSLNFANDRELPELIEVYGQSEVDALLEANDAITDLVESGRSKSLAEGWMQYSEKLKSHENARVNLELENALLLSRMISHLGKDLENGIHDLTLRVDELVPLYQKPLTNYGLSLDSLRPADVASNFSDWDHGYILAKIGWYLAQIDTVESYRLMDQMRKIAVSLSPGTKIE